MNSSEYQVTIKSANQKVDDYVTKCRASWTVHRLKQHISETHVNKPSIEDQRLIYAGNLLKDTHTLKQVFFRDSLCTELTNSSKSDFTLHLVCYTHSTRLVSNPSSGNGQTVSSQPLPATSTTTTTTTATTPNASSSSEISAQTTGASRTRAGIAAGSSSSGGGSGTPRPNQQASINRSTPITIFNNMSSSLPHVQTTSLNATQQAEMVQNLMRSDQMRQQMATFQQLACTVAAQIVSNIANNSNRSVSLEATTNEQFNQSRGLMPVINGQTLNDQIATSPINHHITTTTASQLLYATDNQQTQLVQADTHDTRAGARQNNAINNENNANAQGVGEPAGPQFGYHAPMQAQAPVVEQPAPQPVNQEVPIIQHDVIDWVYYSIRAAVLMAALYIHASMFRLLFIVALLAIAYFFNRRSARRAGPDRQEPQQQQQPLPQELNVAVDQQQIAQNDGGLRVRNLVQGEQRPNLGDHRNNETDNAQRAGAQEDAVPGRVPFLKLCYLVVTDFLASLVPE